MADFRSGLTAACLGMAVACCGSVLDDVDVFIGTAGSAHTTPAAACPFGMVQAGPDTGTCDWRYCSGYQFGDAELIGFSQTHLSGTGDTDLGDVRLLPFVGSRMPERTALDKVSERASPGWYEVSVGEPAIKVSIAAAPRSAVYRLVYPDGSVPSIKLEPCTGISRSEKEAGFPLCCEVRATSARRIVGHYRRKGWALREVFFVLESDRDFTLAGSGAVPAWGKYPRYRMDFSGRGGAISLRLAVSHRSAEGAERNLAGEVAHRTFDEVRQVSAKAWTDYLSRVELPEDLPPERRTIFRTALYHLFFQPNLISDIGDPDEYGTFSFWDTFRAAHPLYTLLVPELVPDFLRSIVWQGRREGRLPTWSLCGHDVQSMIGTHSIPVLVDAYLKGFSGVDWNEVYALVKNTLTQYHYGRENENWDLLDRFGYIPADAVSGESVSRTLENAYDDACAAKLAKALGHAGDAAFFSRRADCWTNVFDRTIGFARPRLMSGAWQEPFDPLDSGYLNSFTEGNSWQYSWHVLHDPQGLISAMGGAEEAVEKLTRLFDQKTVRGNGWAVDMTGVMGQYVQGNEPSHHIPWLFALAGRRDLTDAFVGKLCDRFYSTGPEGLCGNDDCGQLSAWYLCAAMGFYPVDPCGGDYVLSAPRVSSLKIRVGEGRALTIRAEGGLDGGRVESVSFSPARTKERNAIVGNVIRHADMKGGGELVFKMRPKQDR